MGEGEYKPNEGNEFFFVDMTIHNKAQKAQWVSTSSMFKVVNKEDGRNLPMTTSGTILGKGQFDEQIQSGRKMNGEYVVQKPIGLTGLELEFSSDKDGKNIVVFALD